MINLQDLILQAVEQSNLSDRDKVLIAVGMELQPTKRAEALGLVETILTAEGAIDRDSRDIAAAFDFAKLIELIIILLPVLRDLFGFARR